ncbi:hypothetical protein BN7_5868 [Wickerhamomyces ciferrii]|uniref:Zn(2)-C6 fungal-type domain-containing protein n=1 Tax=Wickerhamomyces ciferrii (strain ATCC 14091 / BCRC 22168 / CBS 111 / JCM 3599 / NBRC 0793 / NRRL Y-1031 F-60-10) TaxID=1206466 RepID=K0KT16_WICCF|nr:uncharacterized protein BN7_5868 [Wickerhamomyces ciferrii]CCH46276.1 hypothetical protein BN7_5868 [Wickerhamomyces ciferrii]
MALSKENNNIIPKDVKKRLYKSRKQRPCDNCRKRKSCCIIEDGIPCKLCKMFNKSCTFEKGPVYTTTKLPSKKALKQQKQQQLQQQSLIQSFKTQAGISSASSLNFQPLIDNQHISIQSQTPTYHQSHIANSSTPETPSLYNEQRSNSAGSEISNDVHNFPTPINDSIDMYLNSHGINLDIDALAATSLSQEQYPQQTFNQQSVHEHTCQGHDEGLEELWDMPFDLDMNLDALNFQAGFFDNLNIDFEQLMG